MWASLSKDILGLIFDNLLDGRSGVYCSLVCKQWKIGVENNKKMMEYIYRHYIKVEKIVNLEKTFSKKPLQEWPFYRLHSDVLRFIRNNKKNYEDYQFQIHCNAFCHLEVIYPQLYMGEGLNYYKDYKGNLVMINNYYDDLIKGTNKEKQMFQTLNTMKKEFNSQFDWKFIKFPKLFYDRKIIYGHEYHRGTSLYMIFKMNDNEKEPIYKKIKKK